MAQHTPKRLRFLRRAKPARANYGPPLWLKALPWLSVAQYIEGLPRPWFGRTRIYYNGEQGPVHSVEFSDNWRIEPIEVSPIELEHVLEFEDDYLFKELCSALGVVL